MSSPTSSPIRSVSVNAPARLHLGFLDLNGELGRRFGGLGVGISGLSTQLSMSYSRSTSITGEDAVRAEHYLREILAHLQIDKGIRVHIEQHIPQHVGLGSGTQMALAIGMGVVTLCGSALDAYEVAHVLGRGHRSGIGIGAFTQGGFIVDGGKGGRENPPPLIACLPFPPDWVFVLVLDNSERGMNGDKEEQVFKEPADMPASDAAELCRLVLMQALPALVETDCTRFGAAISNIQAITGDYFAPLQGGRFTSSDVETITAFLFENGATGIGQTSWGPTGFAIFPEEAMACSVIDRFDKDMKHYANIELLICKASNKPAKITINP